MAACSTNLKLPHHNQNKGSVQDALDDDDAVGEFGPLCDLHIFLCREFKSKHKEECDIID